MNAAQIHLALNHAPLFLSLVGGILLFFGMINKNQPVRIYALYLLVAGAILTIPVYLSGEGAEEVVEKFPGFSDATVENHESMAGISLIIILITGLIALLGLIAGKRTGFVKWIFLISVILSVVSAGTIAWTAHLGGLIRHPELENRAAGNVNDNPDQQTGPGEEHDD